MAQSYEFKNMDRKTVKNRTPVLVKLLAITAIPTTFFLIEFAIVVNFTLGNMGYVQLLQFGDSLEFIGREGSLRLNSLSILIVSFLCCVIFLISIVLLIRDWRVERKKRK